MTELGGFFIGHPDGLYHAGLVDDLGPSLDFADLREVDCVKKFTLELFGDQFDI